MDPFHKLDYLIKAQATHWEWIEYLEAERKILMASIDDLEGVVSQIVEDYASLVERDKAREERIGVAVDKLKDAHATLMGQAAPEAAPAAPMSAETADDASTQ